MDPQLVEELVKRLVQHQQSLAVAESCTGGLLSAQLTALSGVSTIYHGAVVAYSNDVKTKLLNVPHHLLLSVGAVSQPVALCMAQGARNVMNATWGIAITGIAGPSGGTPQKPVGTVCFAVAGPSVERTDQQLFGGDRVGIQFQSVEHAIKMLLRELA